MFNWNIENIKSNKHPQYKQVKLFLLTSMVKKKFYVNLKIILNVLKIYLFDNSDVDILVHKCKDKRITVMSVKVMKLSHSKVLNYLGLFCLECLRKIYLNIKIHSNR